MPNDDDEQPDGSGQANRPRKPPRTRSASATNAHRSIASSAKARAAIEGKTEGEPQQVDGPRFSGGTVVWETMRIVEGGRERHVPRFVALLKMQAEGRLQGRPQGHERYL